MQTQLVRVQKKRYQVHKQIQKAAEVKNSGDSASVTKPGREQAKIKLVTRGDNRTKNTRFVHKGGKDGQQGQGLNTQVQQDTGETSQVTKKHGEQIQYLTGLNPKVKQENIGKLLKLTLFQL